MRLDDLTRAEQLALAGLVHVLVRMDGQLSPAEVSALAPIANELGGVRFWGLLREASQLIPDSATAKAYAAQVERADVQAWMFGLLLRVAAADTKTDPETRLLRWLTEAWQL